MRRSIIVIVSLLVLSVTAIVVANLRVKGKIVLPSETVDVFSNESVLTPPVKDKTKTVSSRKMNLRPPPPDSATPTPSMPPEGWAWLGNLAFHKDAKIQSNYRDGAYGYEVPAQYTENGTLVVASKYDDHSACIWSYDAASRKFVVLRRKTLEAVGYIFSYTTCDRLLWVEAVREYTGQRKRQTGEVYQMGSEEPIGYLLGGGNGDQSGFTIYDDVMDSLRKNTEGIISKSTDEKNLMPFPLRNGALEMVWDSITTEIVVPFLKRAIGERRYNLMSVRDPLTGKIFSSISTEGTGGAMGQWDLGQNLLIQIYISREEKNVAHRQRVVLLAYPELRVVAVGSLPLSSLRIIPLKKGKLALDMIVEADNWANSPSGTAWPGGVGGNPKLYHVRVPEDWRRAAGQKRLACIWEDAPRGLGTLEVTPKGEFDVAKYDAQVHSNEKADSKPENIRPSYTYRDGVMYWRKRQTGEVVMAALTDLDTQTVIGGAGTTWDGFRLNPARDELVTWRENGELVFWNVQFPTAEPLYRARVITDETPHRLEAM